MTNTVAPSNMGNRLTWNEKGKKYDVDVDDLIKRIEALENQEVLKPLNLHDLSYLEPGAVQVPNLNNIQGFGWKPFYGHVANDDFSGDRIENGSNRNMGKGPLWVVGAPTKDASEWRSGDSISGALALEDIAPNQAYDFTGYQLATPVEIIQVMFHMGKTLSRTNDRGMRPDGSLVDKAFWTDWQVL